MVNFIGLNILIISMASNKRLKKYFDNKYLLGYYLFSVLGSMLYLLKQDDMRGSLSISTLVIKSVLYGVVVFFTLIATMWLSIQVYKKVNPKRKSRRAH